jgi:5-(carboxyamino)imidazole ribonucleotide synthase
MSDIRTNAPLPPRSVIGILGSGQLGKMLAQAASRLGFRVHVYGDEAGPAFDVATRQSVGSFTSLERLDDFAATVDVVTYEFENVPVAAAEHLALSVPVRPGPRALAVSQDRIVEKTFIRNLGTAVAPFAAIADAAGLAAAANAQSGWGTSAILKTARLGYDGKGQAVIDAAVTLGDAFDALGRVPCVLEQRLNFQCEVSVLVVRGVTGETAIYDIPVNEHAGGILRRSTIPAGLPPDVEARAREMAKGIANALDYVGVLAVEMFYLGDNAPEPLVVNEIAPRVHNSGHWTIDACVVSQF